VGRKEKMREGKKEGRKEEGKQMKNISIVVLYKMSHLNFFYLILPTVN
jgi:hypothetical protein